MENYFAHLSAARRYASGRPYFHPIVADIIRAHIVSNVGRALDVACGTGLSTRMLAEFADEVVGVDSSEKMLEQAFQGERISYQVSTAEDLPFGAGAFGIISVALAFHWFQRDRFVAEAHRILAQNGWLVIYNHWFKGVMASQSRFSRWNELYLAKYPSPKRDNRPFMRDDAEQAGFEVIGVENFQNYWPFSVEQLAHYLVTQSNVIAAVEGGNGSVEDVNNWIINTAKEFFSAESETFLFGGTVSIYRKR